VVYCTINGFGLRELRDRPGYDFVIQAESGLMSITGEPDGTPMKVGVAADERYATNEARVRNRESLVAKLEAVFASRPTEDWVRLLLSSGVLAGKIRGVGEDLRMAAETGAPATAGGCSSDCRHCRARGADELGVNGRAPVGARAQRRDRAGKACVESPGTSTEGAG
jgi:crotonobetainyl-CoA:carnitine CoA-transferase CaiB-like acyl-CoA transferase